MNALRAFEASSRLGSFVLAAQELGVTPGAVAAHVKALEAEIGAQLFERKTRAIALTPLAQRVLPEFAAAFDALSDATQSLRSQAAPQHVHIAALPAVAQLWLSPRLPALRKVAPDISVSITAMEAPPNLKRVPFDLSIFYRQRREGLWLEDDVIFPACAPSLAARLREPSDLKEITCLIDAVWREDWATWVGEAAPGLDFAPRGPVFSLYALAVTEAVNGAGVLMGHEALVRTELQSGRLVAPFGIRVALPRHLSVSFAARPKKGSAAERLVSLLKSQSL